MIHSFRHSLRDRLRAVVGELSGLVGDKCIRAQTRADALPFRNLLMGRVVGQATVKQNFE